MLKLTHRQAPFLQPSTSSPPCPVLPPTSLALTSPRRTSSGSSRRLQLTRKVMPMQSFITASSRCLWTQTPTRTAWSARPPSPTNHHHGFVGSFKCEENLDGALRRSLSDACRPPPDRTLCQSRPGSSPYRSATWSLGRANRI